MPSTRFPLLMLSLVFTAGPGCSSASKKTESEILKPLPASVILGEPVKAHRLVGTVRTWQEFPSSLDDSFSEQEWRRRCERAFHEAALKLLKIAQQNGGHAVARIQSVIFLADGRKEFYSKPECADDGETGEVLVEGQAIAWEAPRTAAGSPKAAPAKP